MQQPLLGFFGDVTDGEEGGGEGGRVRKWPSRNFGNIINIIMKPGTNLSGPKISQFFLCH